MVGKAKQPLASCKKLVKVTAVNEVVTVKPSPPPDNTATGRKTPYQRLKDLISTQTSTTTVYQRVITSVEDLQAYTKARASVSQEKVTVRLRLLWISDHTYKQYSLVRLHLTDVVSPEPLEELKDVRIRWSFGLHTHTNN
ncbi:hypothetical protein V7S43_007130 [Phytophthora oleae]|uniref:Uncharacterized protein n=1 Tax=Phytophthora oleae TaxID=2107226 RepID=A0ABD3FML2_9STRA